MYVLLIIELANLYIQFIICTTELYSEVLEFSRPLAPLIIRVAYENKYKISAINYSTYTVNLVSMH